MSVVADPPLRRTVWEQTAYLIVSDDEIRAKEDLSIQLWDSDARASLILSRIVELG